MRAAYVMFVTIACLGSAAVRADPLGCLIQPYQEADIGTQVVGVIDHVLVERGDFVKKGQPVAQLNSDVERAALAAAKLRAEATADLRAAASNHEFAQKKKVRTDDLYQKNFVSQQATDQAATEAQVAEMKLRQAREQQRLAQQELALAQAQLAQRTIRSPLNGVVIEKYLSEGERVEEKAVVKVATIDPLKVEVIVPASYFSKIKQGMGANVKPDMPDVGAQSAKVVVVDKVIDAASNSFRVRLELPNPNYQLPPGLRCKVDFDLGAPTADSAPQKPATRPSADNAQPKSATAPSADSTQQKPMARPSVAAASK
ncbi:MAG TPA: efflux RND transporter periplasmic adaptor subunit [Burkholderiales bacterium]|nr:efflux RND transporter periplasmic adaptor subunit [Burkholderiales bacterium]